MKTSTSLLRTAHARRPSSRPILLTIVVASLPGLLASVDAAPGPVEGPLIRLPAAWTGTFSGSTNGEARSPASAFPEGCVETASITLQGSSYSGLEMPRDSPAVCGFSMGCADVTEAATCFGNACPAGGTDIETIETATRFEMRITCTWSGMVAGWEELVLEYFDQSSSWPFLPRYFIRHDMVRYATPSPAVQIEQYVHLQGFVTWSPYPVCTPFVAIEPAWAVQSDCVLPLVDEGVACGAEGALGGPFALRASGYCGNIGSAPAACMVGMGLGQEGGPDYASVGGVCGGLVPVDCGVAVYGTFWPYTTCVDGVIPVGPLYLDLRPDSPCLVWAESNRQEGLQEGGADPDTCLT